MTCLVVCLGCGDGKIATFPVTGTVTVDGQPAEGALLIFCPVGGSEEFSKVRPAGKTKSGGKYELSTFDALDGAPAGEYQVMVRWAPENQQSTEEGRDDRARRPQDRLRGRYFRSETSGLTATVDEGATEIPTFHLTTN